MRSVKVIISGGGTGGHIFPAISIANALKKMDNNIEILFVGANGKMEMEKVPAAGYEIKGLDITGLSRSISLENLAFPFRLFRSIIKSKEILRSFRPDVVVGVGGFASGPLVFAATRKKIPALIQEQNSYAGITNKLLGKWANKVCVAYENMEKFFPEDKIVMTGNPVRQDILEIEGKRNDAIKYFKLNDEKTTLLVIGGSLGSRTLNHCIQQNLDQFMAKNIQVIWQTGKSFCSTAKSEVKDIGADNIKVHDFISRMDFAYAAADVVISRAGASSISELAIVGKPAILVPYPYAAEDHQTKNAMTLVESNAAIHVKDSEAVGKLVNQTLTLINDKEKQNDLKKNILNKSRPSADMEIAKEIMKLVNQKN